MAYVLFLLLFGHYAGFFLIIPEDKVSVMAIAIALTRIMGSTVFNNVHETIFKGFVRIFVGSIVGLLVAKYEELKEWKRRGYEPVLQADRNWVSRICESK